jgi:hypothetical protein
MGPRNPPAPAMMDDAEFATTSSPAVRASSGSAA